MVEDDWPLLPVSLGGYGSTHAGRDRRYEVKCRLMASIGEWS